MIRGKVKRYRIRRPTPMELYYEAKTHAGEAISEALDSVDDGDYTNAVQELFTAIEQCRLAQRLKQGLA